MLYQLSYTPPGYRKRGLIQAAARVRKGLGRGAYSAGSAAAPAAAPRAAGAALRPNRA